MVNLETRHITHEATLDLLQRYPDLVGFYVAGGGMEGAIAALREENMAGRHDRRRATSSRRNRGRRLPTIS